MGNASRDPLKKVFAVLNWMLDHGPGPWGVREMAAALSMTPSTTHRLLQALDEDGLVQRQPATGRYELGLEFYRLAHAAVAQFGTERIALPLMRTLVEACNETAFLGLYDAKRREMIFAASVESTHPLRYVVETARWMPVYAGASGLAIMAFLPESERRDIIAVSGLRPLTDGTITNPDLLEQELALTRQRGFAISRGQRIAGAIGLAAPIFGATGEVTGDICLTLPESRFETDQETWLAQQVVSCASLVSERLQGRRSAPGLLAG